MWIGYLNLQCGSHELNDWETKITEGRIVRFAKKDI